VFFFKEGNRGGPILTQSSGHWFSIVHKERWQKISKTTGEMKNLAIP